jgi:hypothetical protein
VITPGGQPDGLVNVLDILLDQNGSKPLHNYVRRIVTTTEDESAYRVVQQLRAARLGLAAVLDRKKSFCRNCNYRGFDSAACFFERGTSLIASGE